MTRAAWVVFLVCWAAAGWLVLRPMKAEHPERTRPILVSIDTDGDGWIQPGEAGKVLPPGFPFARLDLNGDGRLGLAEVEASLIALDPLWWVEGPG